MGAKGKVKTLKAEPIGQDYVQLYKDGLVSKEFAQMNMGLPKWEPEVQAPDPLEKKKLIQEQKFLDEKQPKDDDGKCKKK
jgi:hypothetical protein